MIAIYRQILSLLTARERWRLLLLFIMVVAVGIFEIIGVASIVPFLAVLADPGIIERDQRLGLLKELSGAADPQDFLRLLGVGVFVLVVSGLLFKAFTYHALFRFTSGRIVSLSTRLMRGCLTQPYVWHLNRNSADLGKAMLSEVDRAVNNALIPAMRCMAQAVVVASLVGLLVAAEPTVALGAGALLGSGYVLAFALSRQSIRKRGAQQVIDNAERFRIAGEALGGIKDIKTMNLEEGYLARFAKPIKGFSQAECHALTLAELPRHLLEAIAFGGMLLLVLLLLTGDGAATLTDLLPLLGLYAFAGIRLFPATQQLYANFTRLRFGAPALAALADMLRDASTGASEPIGPAPASLGLRATLALSEVSFRYPGASRPALDGLNMTIKANTTVGIVGGTGAGKTTAIDVLLGLITPDEGALLVDGVEIDDGNRRAWRSSIGYVPQQIYLTDDSIAGNIAFGESPERIDRDAVERAARIAELHDFVVTQTPEGYDTVVGERGVRLSGGQRQRIGIARALYRDPAVLIFDEATSALDNLTERAVMDAVRNLGHRKTVVLVAHRLSTVRACDEIFLFEKGRVAAQGRYDDLVRENARFKALAEAGAAL